MTTSKMDLLKETIAKKDAQIDILKYMLAQLERERDVLVWDMNNDQVKIDRADRKSAKSSKSAKDVKSDTESFNNPK